MPVAFCPNCGYDARGLPSDLCPECGQRLPDVAPSAGPQLRWRLACAGVTIAATVAVAWFTTMIPGVARWWGPLPLTFVIPYFITENPVLAIVPITLAAFLLSIPLLLGCVRVPWWIAIPVLGIVVLAWYYFAIGVSYGLEYQGGAYVAVCVSIQVGVTLALAGLWIADRRRQSYIFVFLWHLLASVWLASYAFPYYGELP